MPEVPCTGKDAHFVEKWAIYIIETAEAMVEEAATIASAMERLKAMAMEIRARAGFITYTADELRYTIDVLIEAAEAESKVEK
jgi:hypothetical protein